MASINEQLGVPILNNGLSTYQPRLYGGSIGEYSAQNAPVVIGTTYYRSANGKESWSGCNSCGNGFSNATGGDRTKFELCFGKCGALHPFNKTKKEACINECKQKYGITSIADYVTAGQTSTMTQQIKDKLPDTLGGNKPTRETSNPKGNVDDKTSDLSTTFSMSTNTKIILGISAVAIIGVILLIRKRK